MRYNSNGFKSCKGPLLIFSDQDIVTNRALNPTLTISILTRKDFWFALWWIFVAIAEITTKTDLSARTQHSPPGMKRRLYISFLIKYEMDLVRRAFKRIPASSPLSWNQTDAYLFITEARGFSHCWHCRLLQLVRCRKPGRRSPTFCSGRAWFNARR